MHKKIVWLLLLLLCTFFPLHAQEDTFIDGLIVDAETGETLPLVQVYFVQKQNNEWKPTHIGTTSDLDGKFSIPAHPQYTTLCFQMIGYKNEYLTIRKGQNKHNLKIKLNADTYSLQDIIVKPKKEKQKYRRKGNPAVELIKNVIAHKDSFNVKTQDHYTAETYHRMSFALENFTPDFNKPFWKNFLFIQKYIDTTELYPSITLSIRENFADEYYQRRPRKEKHIVSRKRIFGLESLLTSSSLQENMNAVFTDIDINDDNINALFNRFVSPLSEPLAVSYYQYYLADTLLIDGDSCIDLAFVPVNSQSYSFTGHLYIVNDSTYKLKKYSLTVPKEINLNFVSDYTVEHQYKRLENGLWAPDRTTTSAKFFLFNRKKNIIARQTKIYTDFDFQTPLNLAVFSPSVPTDTVKPPDSTSIREDFLYWDTHRPEPLSFYEGSVMDLVAEFKATPKFNSLLMAVDAITTEYVATVPSSRWGESKWDFGPIYNTISWNPLEGVRLRIGGVTTANLHPQLFLSTYLAFGTQDLLPKGNVSLMWSFNKKHYHQYEAPRHYIQLQAQYDVEEPGQQTGIITRDHILMSIPTSKPTMKNYQYVWRAKATYMKEWHNGLTLKAGFDFENNTPAGALYYSRVKQYAGGNVAITQQVPSYNNYEGSLELRYINGSPLPIDRMGTESPFTVEQDAPIISLRHTMGYLDDRYTGGQGFYYNTTTLSAEKRFWFSSFGHLDAKIQAGGVWNKVPFTKLYFPATSTSIFLGKSAFNLMQPMEFMMDYYVSLFATYYFKGWVINRIPLLNKTKLRGVVSVAAIYGGLTDKNNPYLPGNENLYIFPNNATYDHEGKYVSGYTSSPIGKIPYVEMTFGIENILKFIRIDYVRRFTYNDYLLPDGIHHRQIKPWGRNGVKVTIRFAL